MLVSDPPFHGRVLRHPEPKADEFLPGYLLRVAEENSYDDWHWLTRQAQLGPNFATKPDDLTPLAKLLARDAKELQSLCWWPVDGDARTKIHKVGTGRLHRSVLRPRDPKYCPLCLGESPHMRRWWNLAVVPACPTHKVLLLDHCPKCGSPMKWKRPDVLRCPTCGTPYDQAKAPKAAESVVALSSFFLRALGTQYGESQSVLPEVFTSLPADLAAQAVYLLGGYATGLAKGSAHRLMSKADTGQVVDVFAAAGSILMDWPNGFRTLLEQVRSRSASTATRCGLESEFGPFYKALNALRHPQHQFLHREFAAYINEEWAGGYLTAKNTRLSTGNLGPARYVTRAEAARRLHVRPEAIDSLINGGVLRAVHRQAGQRRMVLIEGDDVAGAMTRTAELLTGQQVGELLGLSKAALRPILHHNLLVPVRGPGIDGYCRPMYRRPDAEGLLAAVLGCAAPGREGDGIVSLEGVIRRVTAAGMTVADILQEVLCGRLPVAAQDVGLSGLKRALFLAEEITAMILRGRISPEHRLTMTEAARRLGIKDQVMSHLVKIGLLSTVLGRRGTRTLRMIDADELHRFSQTYASGSEVAIHLRTSPRHAAEMLAKQGIHAVTGPDIDGGRQWFFLRKGIAADFPS